MHFINGEFTETTPTINVADFGFARGITVFELFRVYAGKPFRMEEHLYRLQHGAAELGIKLPFTLAELSRQAGQLIAHHGYAHSAVKIYLTAGKPKISSGLSFAACTDFTPSLIMMEDEVKPQHPLAPYGLEVYQRGQKLVTVNHIRELPEVKTANYGIGYVQANKHPEADDILFVAPTGTVTEATRSNFFCVINGHLVTANYGMLKGITRKVVLELAEQCGIPCELVNLTPQEVAQATEAFTCGSIAELVPVASINGQPMHATWNAPVFQRLRHAFTEVVAKETGYRPEVPPLISAA